MPLRLDPCIDLVRQALTRLLARHRQPGALHTGQLEGLPAQEVARTKVVPIAFCLLL